MRGTSGIRYCLLSVVALALVAVAPRGARAQLADDDADIEPEAPAAEVRAEGEYGGVTPGDGAVVRGAKRARRPLVTWVGYLDREDGAGSQVFLQLNRDAQVEQTVAGGKLYVTVSGARFASKNERRRIDLRYFATPVREINGRQAPRRRRASKRWPAGPAGAMLVFEFKDPADASPVAMDQRTEEDGLFYVYLDFPPGAAQQPPARAADDDLPAAGTE